MKAPKTKKSQRTDHLPAFVCELLVSHKSEQLAHLVDLTNEPEARRRLRDGYVFLRHSGEQWNPNELSRQFSRLIRRKKLPLFRFHDLRHGFASLAFAAGVPLKTVSEWLGHSGIAITSQLYVHLLADQKREKAAFSTRTSIARSAQHRKPKARHSAPLLPAGTYMPMKSPS